MSDYTADLERLLEVGGKAALKRWQEILEQGGKVTVRRACQHCNQPNVFETDNIDVEEQRRILEYATSYVKAKPKAGDETTANQTEIARLMEQDIDLVPYEALVKEAFQDSPGELKEWLAYLKRLKPGKPSK